MIFVCCCFVSCKIKKYFFYLKAMCSIGGHPYIYLNGTTGYGHSNASTNQQQSAIPTSIPTAHYIPSIMQNIGLFRASVPVSILFKIVSFYNSLPLAFKKMIKRFYEIKHTNRFLYCWRYTINLCNNFQMVSSISSSSPPRQTRETKPSLNRVQPVSHKDRSGLHYDVCRNVENSNNVRYPNVPSVFGGLGLRLMPSKCFVISVLTLLLTSITFKSH